MYCIFLPKRPPISFKLLGDTQLNMISINLTRLSREPVCTLHSTSRAPHRSHVPPNPKKDPHTQRRRQIASAPPRLRCSYVSPRLPLSDRRTPPSPPTPCPIIMGHAGLFVRPSLSPSSLPPITVLRGSRAPIPPPPHTQHTLAPVLPSLGLCLGIHGYRSRRIHV